MKYFLKIAYKGLHYHGWQRQSQVQTVQATIEDNLRKIFRSDLTIHGCGRTVTGVNASQYYAHFVVERDIDFDLVYKLNRMLPGDIVIYDLLPVQPKANAQLDAMSRTYEYHIHLQKDPFLVDKSACYDLLDLDLNLIKAAVFLLTQYQDFRYFCLQPDLHNHTRCDLRDVQLQVSEDQKNILLTFTADRFLRGMIRILVGRLLDVGQKKITLDDLEKSLRLEQPNRFMTQAFPQGLYLSWISYPEEIFL